MMTVSGRSSTRAIGLGVIVLAVGASLEVVMLSAGRAAQVGLLMGIVLVVFLISAKPTSMHVSLAVALFMFAHTHLGQAFPSVSLFARPLALVVLVVLSLKIRVKGAGGPTLREIWLLFACGITAYGIAIISHGLDAKVGTNSFSFALSCSCLILVVHNIPGSMLFKGVQRMALLAMLGSLAAGVLTPGTALAAGRLEGLFVNANTLGFFAGLGVMVGVIATTRRAQFTALLVSSIVLVATGSRSALLAIAVAMIFTALRVIVRAERDSLRLIGLTAVGCVGGYFAINSVLGSNLSILRENDSRSNGTAYAEHVLATAPWRGVGFGRSQVEIASTPLRWLAEAGLVGLAMVVLAYLLVLVLSWRRSWPAFLIAVYGVVSSLFEGWYFAGGSGLFLTYWFVYICAARSPSGPDPVPGRDTAAHARVRLLR